MLQPAVSVDYSEAEEKFLAEGDPAISEATKFVRI